MKWKLKIEKGGYGFVYIREREVEGKKSDRIITGSLEKEYIRKIG